ncbi:MAG: FAD-dependent oxidoreductase [Ruminococcaceae bacterium]|nr:FAD-dependent oxidoreductase [Oscillospiraceae bacterium]
MHELFIEAESFRSHGGWIVDGQSMETIHSAYLMAHGMGIPVADAETTFEIPADGVYHVWALTRDWTAVWGVEESAGRFTLCVDGASLETVLGTAGAEWAWQKAGVISLTAGAHTLALHDLTGFNGRCDALYLTTFDETPASDLSAVDALRRRLGWREIEDIPGEYDLIVAGGGIAGICTALSAIRLGCNALLIHDRGMLGGCNSSEVRVCMGGLINLPPYPNLGNVVKEVGPVFGSPQRFDARYYEDDRKFFAFEASNACDRVIFNECVTDVEHAGGKISAVITTNVLTGRKKRYRAALFADCTGDAVLSRLSGCETMYGRESTGVFGETLAPAQYEKLVMGHSIRWYTENRGEAVPFPDIDWKLPFNDRNCLNVFDGDWEQETGFSRDMVGEIEYIRDFGLRAIYSNWAYQKNHYCDRAKFADYALKWVSPIGGKRESYRVVGDLILTQTDIEEPRIYDDATACLTWEIDMHFPECDNAAEYEEPFRSFAYHRGINAPYPVPYRCLYARDISNLFLGGRTVSMSHVAFSSVRVMRTLGMLGEVIGMAASICARHGCTPREVYAAHLDELKAAMEAGVPIPTVFGWYPGSGEKYHFKDIGWLHLNPYRCDERYLEKFKRGIDALGIRHRYPLPDVLK